MLPRVAAAVDALGCGSPADAALDLDAGELLDAYADGAPRPGDVIDACLCAHATPTPLGAIWAIDAAGRAGRCRRLGGPLASRAGHDRWRACRSSSRTCSTPPALATTGGSAWLADRVPTVDAGVVAAVRAAGAIVVAKTATYELGCGNEPIPFGPVRNPWDRDAHHRRLVGRDRPPRSPPRLAPLALGTDTGGSIRIPSAWCGTVGLKPTLGRTPERRSARAGADARRRRPDGPHGGGRRHGCSPCSPVSSPSRRRVAGRRGSACSAAGSPTSSPTTSRRAFERRRRHARRSRRRADRGRHRRSPSTARPLSWLITMAEAARTYADAPRDLLSPAFRGRLEVGERIERGDVRGRAAGPAER